MAIQGSSRVGGGSQLFAEMQQRKVTQQSPRVATTDSTQGSPATAKAETKQKALATKAKSQKLKAMQASSTDKQGKTQRVKQQTQRLQASQVQGNSQQLGQALSTQTGDSETSQFVRDLGSGGDSQAEIAKKVKAGQARRAQEKAEARREKLTEAQEDTRETIGDVGDVIGLVDDGLEEAGALFEGLSESTEALGELTEGAGDLVALAKFSVTLKHVIENPTTKGKVDLGSALAELSGFEDIKGVSSLIEAAHEIYSKQQDGKLSTGVAMEQLAKVSDQLGNTLEALVDGDSFVQAVAPTAVSALSWASSYMPTAVTETAVSYASSAAEYMPASDTVSSWIPGINSFSAGAQFAGDLYNCYTGKDGDGKDLKYPGTKALCSGVKFAASFAPGAGKLVSVGCDLLRWGFSGTKEDSAA